MTPIEVHFTIDDRDRGDAIAQSLLAARTVACWQRIGPIESHYWWQGAQESATEWRYSCKTSDLRLDEVVAAIVAGHPYEVPEVIATPLVGGAPPYLDWIATETSGEGEP